ncbi:dockerin type I domain-containing protein [Halorubrum kocurii]|uniref:dockerin type I domain-containing protein n=1 Tax=Halorubrum kocurii TaxID=478441 RepID=UPI000AF2E225|nr:dockerin type I domain-containing protein [Halorubrum kocurii]
MNRRWYATVLALILLMSLPGSVVTAGFAASPSETTESVSIDTAASPEPPDPQPTNHAQTFTVTAKADGSTVPWRSNRLPGFVGDAVTLQVDPVDGYEFVNASWKKDGPAAVVPTAANNSTAKATFETQGETTLQITATVRNTETNETIERTSSPYTLISTPTDLDVGGFSVSYAESPDRWDKAAVSAHLRDLPRLRQNLTQRLPVPSQVDLVYTTRDDIQQRCSSFAYACVISSNDDATMYMPYDVGNYTLATRADIYRHELTHVTQFEKLDMAYEEEWGFIVEGHAEYEEAPRFTRRSLEEKPSKQDLLEFTGDDYAQSELFVSAFTAEYGYQSLEEIIRLSRYNTVDQAFQRVVNESFDSFYERWQPTNESRGPNAVRTIYSTSPNTDQIHHKPRFVYSENNLTALGFGPYASGDGVTVSWDTDGDNDSEYTGQTANWTPSSPGDYTITVTYTNGNASLSRTQTVSVSEVPLSPTDVDNDGLYEDVNGDGTASITDVQALFANKDDEYIQNNPEQFDFNGDGQFSVVDVQALFQQVS